MSGAIVNGNSFIFPPSFASLRLPTCRESLIQATPVLNYVIDNKYLSVNWKVYFWQKRTSHQDGWPPSHHVVSQGFGKVHSQRDFQLSDVSVCYIWKVPFGIEPLGSYPHCGIDCASAGVLWVPFCWSYIYHKIKAAILLLDVVQNRTILRFSPVLKVLQK